MSEADNTPTIAGVSFDDLVEAALREKNLMIPVTIEEVARAEAELDEEKVDVPESLAKPPLLEDKERSQVLSFKRPQGVGETNDFRDELARVAREGGELSEEVLETMRKDREMAERTLWEDDEETDI